MAYWLTGSRKSGKVALLDYEYEHLGARLSRARLP